MGPSIQMAVHCHLMGGLGNQLFQIFAAASWALDEKKLLQCSFETTGTPRRSYNGRFFHCTEKPKDASFRRFLEPKHFVFHDLPPWPKIELFGQFQNPRQFQSNFEAILELLRIERPCRPVEPGTVLHIRRSDFKTSSCHELLDLDQYKKQVEGMPKPQHIITDDPRDLFVTQCCEALGATLHQSTLPDAELDEFWYFASHDFIVMSNSTFAWWAARFALHRNPKVVIRECPKFLKDNSSQIPFF